MKRFNKIVVTTGGVLYLLFGLFHITFFKFFGSNPDFLKLKPALAKIVQMLNMGVITFFLMLGIMMLLFRNEILNSKLGRAFLIASSVFFFIRGAAEFFFPEYVLGLVAVMFACSFLYLIPVLGK